MSTKAKRLAAKADRPLDVGQYLLQHNCALTRGRDSIYARAIVLATYLDAHTASANWSDDPTVTLLKVAMLARHHNGLLAQTGTRTLAVRED